jgi:DNA-binding IclR family transcriptional regulator
LTAIMPCLSPGALTILSGISDNQSARSRWRESSRGGPLRGVSSVPAVSRALAVLRTLASHTGPVPAAVLARDLALPRSTVYHLLTVLEREGFVVHLPEARAYGLGVGAFELGSAYLRNDPLERLARPLLARLVEQTGHTVHLGVLHGRETLYLLKEQARTAVPLVTDVGVRLPAHLTAVGRSMLAALPRAQVRALYPNRDAFVDRTGAGPRTPSELRDVLARERARGWSVEDGHVTPGISSIAACVLDYGQRPAAAVGCTFPSSAIASDDERAELARLVRGVADRLARRLVGSRAG